MFDTYISLRTIQENLEKYSKVPSEKVFSEFKYFGKNRNRKYTREPNPILTLIPSLICPKYIFRYF